MLHSSQHVEDTHYMWNEGWTSSFYSLDWLNIMLFAVGFIFFCPFTVYIYNSVNCSSIQNSHEHIPIQLLTTLPKNHAFLVWSVGLKICRVQPG